MGLIAFFLARAAPAIFPWVGWILAEPMKLPIRRLIIPHSINWTAIHDWNRPMRPPPVRLLCNH